MGNLNQRKETIGNPIRAGGSIAATTTLYYYNTHWQVLFEKNAAGTTQRWYVYGNYIDEPLMLVIPPQAGIQKFYYVQDHLYSTAALVDSTGAVVERYEYDAYGKVQFLTSSFRLLTSSRFGNPYLFTGRNVDYFDNSTLKLQYNRNRYYSSSLGRWMTRDPLGITPNGNMNSFAVQRQYQDGMSLYEYVGSMPNNRVDPIGESFIGDFGKGIVKACLKKGIDVALDMVEEKAAEKISRMTTNPSVVIIEAGPKSCNNGQIRMLIFDASINYVYEGKWEAAYVNLGDDVGIPGYTPPSYGGYQSNVPIVMKIITYIIKAYKCTCPCDNVTSQKFSHKDEGEWQLEIDNGVMAPRYYKRVNIEGSITAYTCGDSCD